MAHTVDQTDLSLYVFRIQLNGIKKHKRKHRSSTPRKAVFHLFSSPLTKALIRFTNLKLAQRSSISPPDCLPDTGRDRLRHRSHRVHLPGQQQTGSAIGSSRGKLNRPGSFLPGWANRPGHGRESRGRGCRHLHHHLRFRPWRIRRRANP